MQLKTNNIGKSFSGVNVLRKVDFDLKPEGNALDYRNIPVEIRARIRNSIDPQILYKKSTPLRNLIDIEHDGWNHPEEVRRTLDWFEDHRKQDLKNSKTSLALDRKAMLSFSSQFLSKF